jgi:hypothetical protein
MLKIMESQMSESTTRAAVKESRQTLRTIHNHIQQAHHHTGIVQEDIGLVEVVYHPDTTLPVLNYVTPRRSTAWVPAPEVTRGLDRLRALNRTLRVLYVDELFLPMFAQSLTDLGLQLEREIRLLACKPGLADRAELPAGMRIEPASDDTLWQQIRESGHFNALTQGIEPINTQASGDDAWRTIDLQLRDGSDLLGAARISLYGSSAHLLAVVVARDAPPDEALVSLYRAALKAAAEQSCTLAFVTAPGGQSRAICYRAGFMDAGRLLCYAEVTGQMNEEIDDGGLAQSVFTL